MKKVLKIILKNLGLSGNSRNFAGMIELSTHIEYLLLSHKEVHVPQLGTFVGHEMSSQRIEEEGIFLPPYRTVAFQWNDKEEGEDFLLSLSKLHHLSRREARIMCTEYIDELQQALSEDGTVNIGSMGYLVRSDDEQQPVTFTPLQSGIATPTYYGLDALPFAKLSNDVRQQRDKKQSAKKVKLTTVASEGDTITIRINRRAFNYVASIAASIVLFFTFTSPFTNTIKEIGKQKAELFMTPVVAQQQTPIEEPVAEVVEEPEVAVEEVLPQEEIAEVVEAIEATEAVEPVEDVVAPEVVETTYAIVLASAITKNRAIEYADKLQKQGYKALACTTGKMVRVIIPGFATESDAYNEMKQMKANSDSFSAIWSCKIEDEIKPLQ